MKLNKSPQHSDMLQKYHSNDLLNSCADAAVGDSILYADDIALVSCSCHGLQKLTDICQHYGCVWNIKFNAAKSQSITFGGTHPKCALQLGTHSIQWVN